MHYGPNRSWAKKGQSIILYAMARPGLIMVGAVGVYRADFSRGIRLMHRNDLKVTRTWRNGVILVKTQVAIGGLSILSQISVGGLKFFTIIPQMLRVYIPFLRLINKQQSSAKKTCSSCSYQTSFHNKLQKSLANAEVEPKICWIHGRICCGKRKLML